MGISALVPVQEALHIDNVANIQSNDSGVNIGVNASQINLHTEAVGSAVVVQGDVNVITGLVVLVLDSLNSPRGSARKSWWS